MDSPAPSVMELTPSKPRRSLSRASRKATQEPEYNIYHLSRSAYSLPPTPIASSFEDALPSAKRRKRRGSINYNEKTPQSTYFTASPNVDTSAGFSEVPSTVSKRTRGRKRDTLNGDPASATVSDVSRATTPASSSRVKLKTQVEQPQSTLHAFLSKQPKDSGVAEAVRSGLTDSAESLSDSKDSNAASTTSSKRRSRRSTPAKTNGARSIKSETKSQASTPRSGTPQPSRKDWAPMNTSQASRQSKTPASTRQSTPAAVSVSKLAKTNAMDRSKSTTPAARSRVSTPDNGSSTRSRRSRKMATAATSAPVSDHDGEKNQLESTTKSASEAEPATNRRKSNLITLTLSRKALESVLPKTTDHLQYSPTIADSVEATPVHPYDSGFHFEYDSEMYRNNFGLDGQMDTPASPTSFSTTTSAARISGRTRKPTIRALESFESEKRYRRNRTKTPKPPAEMAPPKHSNEPTTPLPPATTPDQRTPAPEPRQQCTVTDLATTLFELASTAVSADFAPPDEAEIWLDELRSEYRQRLDAKSAPTSGAEEGDSRGTSQFNDFGEELLGVPDGYTWVRPDNTYGDDALPQPPVRLKSCEQIEKDRIYGFPPRIGERNLPREGRTPFVVEDVGGEQAKIKAREDARRKGIVIDRAMSLPEINALVAQHSCSGSPRSLDTPKEFKERDEPRVTKDSKNIKGANDAKPKATRKRRRTNVVVQEQAAHDSPQDTPATRMKRRRKDITGATAPTPTSRPSPAPKAKPATTPRTGTKKDPAAGTKIDNGTGPSSGSASNGVTPNDATASTKRRRRKKKGVILRILGPKGDPSDDRNREHESRKRSFSEVDGSDDMTTEQRTPKNAKISEPPQWSSPKLKLKKPSPEKNRHRPFENKPNGTMRSTPETPATIPETPSTVGNPLDETPDGRPRRAAAAAMIAGSKQDAEKRARKSKARGRKSTGGRKSLKGGANPEPGNPVEPPQTA